MLGDRIVRFPDFPPKLRTLLEHMIVSHHGELEFGSPKVPAFPEALLLHHLDNLDSKMECMRAAIAKDRNVEGCWTAYNSALDRAVLKKMRYMDPPVEVARPEHPPSPKVEAGPEPPRVVREPQHVIPEPQPEMSMQPVTSEPEPLPEQIPDRPISLFAEKLQQAWRRQ